GCLISSGLDDEPVPGYLDAAQPFEQGHAEQRLREVALVDRRRNVVEGERTDGKPVKPYRHRARGAVGGLDGDREAQAIRRVPQTLRVAAIEHQPGRAGIDEKAHGLAVDDGVDVKMTV